LNTPVKDTTSMKPSLFRHFFFWVSCFVAVASASMAVRYGDGLTGVTPVPLRANPTLVMWAYLLLPLFLTAGWIASKRAGAWRWLAWPSVTCAATCCAVLLAAIRPGIGSVVARDIVYAAPSPASGRVFAIPLYFPNGKASLTDAESVRLRDTLAVFASCEMGSLMVRGFASSAPFRRNHDYRNRLLANDRAMGVKAAVESGTGRSVTIVEWTAHEDMVRERRLRDVGAAGERLIDVERLNRRAELFWSDSPCEVGKVPSGGSPK
jgi:hypothetical protein